MKYALCIVALVSVTLAITTQNSNGSSYRTSGKDIMSKWDGQTLR